MNLLFKIKGDVKIDFAQTWDVLLTSMGLGTLLFCAVFAFAYYKTKSLLIFLTQSWLGLGLFLLVPESNAITQIALASLFAFSMTAPKLVMLGKQNSKPFKTLYRVMMIGLPGFLGFSTYYYSIRSIVQLQLAWIVVVMAAYSFQMIALMLNDEREYRPFVPNERGTKMKFELVVAVQLLCAVVFYWLETTGIK